MKWLVVFQLTSHDCLERAAICPTQLRRNDHEGHLGCLLYRLLVESRSGTRPANMFGIHAERGQLVPHVVGLARTWPILAQPCGSSGKNAVETASNLVELGPRSAMSAPNSFEYWPTLVELGLLRPGFDRSGFDQVRPVRRLSWPRVDVNQIMFICASLRTASVRSYV